MELKRRDATEDVPQGAPEDEDNGTGAEKERDSVDSSRSSIKKRELSVIIYTTVLFFVALVLILLSYFIQQRTNTALTDITTQHGEITSQALSNIEELQKKNQELSDSLDTAEDELAAVTASLEAANRQLESLMAEQAGLEQANEAARLQTEALEEELNLQRRKTEALGLLAALLSAPSDGDAVSIAAQLEPVKGNLDAAYLNIYNSYMENLNAAENASKED